MKENQKSAIAGRREKDSLLQPGRTLPGVRRAPGFGKRPFTAKALWVAGIGGGGVILSSLMKSFQVIQEGSATVIQWCGVTLAMIAFLVEGVRILGGGGKRRESPKTPEEE